MKTRQDLPPNGGMPAPTKPYEKEFFNPKIDEDVQE
jgi:hypothetical protein